MGRGSGSIRPHLAVLLLLTGVLAGLLLRTPVPSVPTPLPLPMLQPLQQGLQIAHGVLV